MRFSECITPTNTLNSTAQTHKIIYTNTCHQNNVHNTINLSQTTSIFCTFWCCFPLFLPSKSGSFIAFLITLFINIIRFTKIYIITATQILSKTHFLCLR
eukprot:19060_1